MKQTALTLELRQDNPNIICRWDEHGVSHHKELSFKMMGTLIEQAVQYEPIFTGLLPPNCLAYAKDKNGQERIALLVEMTFTDIRYHDTLYPHFPLPRILYVFTFVRGQRISAIKMAVVDQGYLRPATKLFFYPFSNVSKSGHLCVGCNTMPRCNSLHTLSSVPAYIMSMPNNDDHFLVEQNKEQLPFRSLLARMNGKAPADYYTEVLVPREETLEDFIKIKAL